MIIECTEILTSQELRQGDVLEWFNSSPNWREFAVIITADCDIAKKKNENVFSYCPIISLESFVNQFFALSKIKITSIKDKLKVLIDKKLKTSNNNSDIDIEIYINWLLKDGFQKVSESLEINANPTITELSNILENYYNDEYVDNIQLYIDYQKINKVKDPLKKLNEDIKSFVRKTPGDYFYFNYIKDLPEIGYVINLRRIGMFNFDEIQTNISTRNINHKAKRIGRLVSPFSYRVTQKVGQMFSDIGLPEEYENDCNDAVSIIDDKYRSQYV